MGEFILQKFVQLYKYDFSIFLYYAIIQKCAGVKRKNELRHQTEDILILSSYLHLHIFPILGFSGCDTYLLNIFIPLIMDFFFNAAMEIFSS